MPLISIKQEYFDELEVIYKKNPEWMKTQGLDTLDKFIEEIAMFGLRQFRIKNRNIMVLDGVSNGT